MGRKHILRGGKKDGQNDVEAGEHAARKIDPESRFRNALQKRVSFAIEYRSDSSRSEKHADIDRCGHQEHGQERITQINPHPAPLSRPVRAAHQRLYALGDAGINGDHHEGQVGDHTISRHAGISLQPENHRVEYDDDNPGRNFRDQRRQAGGKNIACLPQPAGHGISLHPQPEPVLFLHKEGRQNAHADDGCKSRGKYRAEDSHA